MTKHISIKIIIQKSEYFQKQYFKHVQKGMYWSAPVVAHIMVEKIITRFHIQNAEKSTTYILLNKYIENIMRNVLEYGNIIFLSPFCAISIKPFFYLEFIRL